MSMSTLTVILARIAAATPRSPIAVFRPATGSESGKLNAVFASTYETQRSLQGGDLIGVFHNQMDTATVRRALDDALYVDAEPVL